MAQLQLHQSASGRKHYHSSTLLGIDMTPMVDLGFLLITFFVFTTALSEPSTTALYMPKGEESGTLGQSTALTLLLADKNKIICYPGKWEKALNENSIKTSSYNIETGVGQIIRERQKLLGIRKDELMLLIKPLDASSYQNFIDAVDETTINMVKRYAVVEATDEEKNYAMKLE